MRLCNLDSAIVVYDVSLFVGPVASAANSCPRFVHTFSSLVLLDNWFSIPIEIEVPSYQMRIEIVLLNIKWSRYFTLIIQFVFGEHCLSIQVINHISSLFINQVATLICQSPIFISELAILILRREDVALLISLKFPNDITLIKSS